MNCPHLAISGHCADPTQPHRPHRPPCTARVCAAKNEARPLHLATLKRLTPAAARTEYIAEVDRAEGSVSGMLLRAEYLEWWERRRNGAKAAPEAAGGAQTGATHAERSDGAEAAHGAGNLEQGN